MIFVAFIQEDNTMFHSDGIDGIFELKNFIADLASRFDDVSMPYYRKHFGEFLSLCEKAGLEKFYLAFYYFYELPKGKRWIEYDDEKDVCIIITLEDGNLEPVNSEGWEASTFLFLLMTIYRHKWFVYLPHRETIDIVHPDPDEENWTPLMKILGAF